jgi:hypothetical protein
MQKQSTWPVTVGALAVLATLLVAPYSGGLAQAESSKPPKAATGPFTYDPAVAGAATYIGEAGEAVTSTVELCAPGGGTLFPTGASSATAALRVFGIEQVNDAEGQPLDEPIEVPLDSPLGMGIEAAFTLTPNSHTFVPNECIDVQVTVDNPLVDDAYGDYIVTIKAQAAGTGTG